MRGPRGCLTPGRDAADAATVSRPRRSVRFQVVCNATAVGCVAMGVKRDPAVRLRVTCGQLKSADQFAPGRRKWMACQQTQSSRADRPGTPHDPTPPSGPERETRRCGPWGRSTWTPTGRCTRPNGGRYQTRFRPPGPASRRSAVRSGRWSHSTTPCRQSGNASPTCSPKGHRRPRSLANSALLGRPRSPGATAGEAVARQRCAAVASAAIPRFSTACCR